VRWKAWWRQSNIKSAVREECASCHVHQDCHVADEVKAALKKSAGVSGPDKKTNVKCDEKGQNAMIEWAQRQACVEAMGFRAK